ncbi:MAG: diguanylate cyclase [Planctomycetota bacterium]
MASSRRVMLAHYDPERREGLATALRVAAGAVELEVITCGDGQEVLDRLVATAPDTLVVSGVLPKVHGFDVCRKAKLNRGKVSLPVVVLTEPGDGYGRGRARQAGADLILTEPLGAPELRDILEAPSLQGDPLDLSKAGSRSHHERLLASIMGKSTGMRDALLARFTDPVTGLYDHNYTRLRLEEEFKKSQRYGTPLSLVLVDVDNYDEIVSRYGPMAGDAAVLDVASVFLCESRDVDVAGRLDRARFVFVLPNTDVEGARVMADRIFNDILERTVDTGDERVPFRLSVGISSCPNERTTTVDELVELAHRGLTAARKSGGNKICVWGEV